MLDTFLEEIKKSIEQQFFIKITISKKKNKQSDLNNIYVRLIALKSEIHLSFTYRYATKDQVKNYTISEGIERIRSIMGVDFGNAILFSSKVDVYLEYNRKLIAKLYRKKPSQTIVVPPKSHDRSKHRLIAEDRPFLQELGISSNRGKVFNKKQDKYRQINKYIETIDGLLKNITLPETLYITDMGSGKGYLTFALYDYLVYQKKIAVKITGIELRKNLTDFCNITAKKLGFEHLEFIAQDINDYQPTRIDILIALHACDTATDLAIHKGITTKAQLIVCAPCCHKQIRKQMNCKTEMNAILKHGIMEERQAEMITDGIRALIMEGHGYQSKIFEFISTTHTPKNLLIVGTKQNKTPKNNAFEKIKQIKTQFGIEYHYLERLLEK